MDGLRLLQRSDRLELRIFDDSNWPLFIEIAEVLEREFCGTWLEKIDGLDQSYWDLRIEDSILTLHLENYLGIMLFPASETPDKVAADSLLKRIHNFLASYEPAA